MRSVRRRERDATDPATRDGGFTLTELLISIAITGGVVGILCTAIMVTLQQVDNTGGRLTVASAEQTVGRWMPADLASAQLVDTSPSANPCRPSTCPASGQIIGSNTLMLEWTTAESTGAEVANRTTRVAYIYSEVGAEFQLIRVACNSLAGGAWICEQNIALHNVDPPPPGITWVPGVTVPDWVIVVSEPYRPDYAGGPVLPPTADPGYQTKNAQRVVVSINGGGDAPGAGGGLNQINLSAGGTNRYNLDTTSVAGAPSFTAARSRCGGNIALIIDESGSIGSSAIVQVRDAIRGFIRTFAGTPVKLELVRFDSVSSVLGSTGWARWFDMLVEADVAALDAAVSQLRSNGGTNWEDAWFRTFFNSNGTVQTTLPDLVVFFTDGVPTYSRLNQSSATAPTSTPPPQGYSLATGSSYNQEAWYRASFIAQQFRSTVRFIGVGVGPSINSTSVWYSSPPVYERGFHYTYERYGNWYERSNKLQFERSNKLIYEQKVGSTWTTKTQAQYDAGNTVAGEADGWRTRVGSGSPNWTSVSTSEAQYWASNTSAGESDGWRTSVSSTKNVTWTETTSEQYYLSNTTGDDKDGWSLEGSSNGWSATTQQLYAAHNTTPDSSDGWRATAAYSSPYDQWEVVSKSVYDSTSSSGRRDNTATITKNTLNSTIIARLIAGTDNGVPTIPEAGGGYSNAAQANMYISPNWADFAGALQSVALAECGGTLTIQTRLGGAAAPDPFTYQNTQLYDPSGTALGSDLEFVSTTRQFVSGTFDFPFPSGQYMTVEIQPQNLSDLVGYQPSSWSCVAGVTPRPVTTFAIPGTDWPGIRVQVSANEAVSCIQTVTRP